MPAKRGYSRAFGSSQGAVPAAKRRRGMARATSYKPKKFILGTTTRATLRYSETVTLTQAAVQGALGSYVFTANGAYDPNNSGAGGQPRGFDELLALYDHYTVVGSTISCRFANQSTGNRPYVAIAVRDTNTLMADVKAVAEYGDKVMSARPLGRISTADSSGISSSIMLSTKCNIAKFLGRRDVMSDPELKGDSSRNPTEGVFYHVVAGDISSAGAGDVDVLVTITYDVILHEPKIPTSS